MPTSSVFDKSKTKEKLTEHGLTGKECGGVDLITLVSKFHKGFAESPEKGLETGKALQQGLVSYKNHLGAAHDFSKKVIVRNFEYFLPPSLKDCTDGIAAITEYKSNMKIAKNVWKGVKTNYDKAKKANTPFDQKGVKNVAKTLNSAGKSLEAYAAWKTKYEAQAKALKSLGFQLEGTGILNDNFYKKIDKVLK